MAMALRLSLPCSKNATFPDTHLPKEPDWSDLPPELICLISWKIADISDFVCFRVVCKRWRSAVRASDLARQLPWIMDNSGSLSKGYLRFYSLLTGKTYTVNVPLSNSTDKSVMGSAYHYLLTLIRPTSECSLFNPLTNEELSLPRAMLLFPSCVPSALSPGQNSMYVVMSRSRIAHHTPFFLCRPGDRKWTRLEVDPFRSKDSTELGEFSNEGFTFYNGRCYACDRETGYIKVIDLATLTVTHVLPQPEPQLSRVSVYLVVSFGVILRVCRYKNYSEKIPCACYFRIYRLELGHGDGNAMDPCWVEIDNISNQFLFLHNIHGCAFRAEDFPGFVGNTIYFSRENCIENTFQFYRYDIKERKIEVLPAPLNLIHDWFVPSLC